MRRGRSFRHFLCERLPQSLSGPDPRSRGGVLRGKSTTQPIQPSSRSHNDMMEGNSLSRHIIVTNTILPSHIPSPRSSTYHFRSLTAYLCPLITYLLLTLFPRSLLPSYPLTLIHTSRLPPSSPYHFWQAELNEIESLVRGQREEIVQVAEEWRGQISLLKVRHRIYMTHTTQPLWHIF